jgi:hypothetical protein
MHKWDLKFGENEIALLAMPRVELNNAAEYSLKSISRKASRGKYKRLWIHNPNYIMNK